MSISRHIWMLMCVVMLSACGFQPRGHLGNAPSLSLLMPAVVLSVPGGMDFFSPPLRTALRQSGVRQLQNKDEAPALTLISFSYTETPLAYGIEGEVRRERIEGALTFKLTGEDTLIEPTVVYATRDRLRYPNYDLSDIAEKEATLSQIHSDLINAMFWQVRVHLQPHETAALPNGTVPA